MTAATATDILTQPPAPRRVPSRAAPPTKGDVVVEGIGRQLDPDLDLLYEMAPFVAAAAVSSAAR